MNEKERQIISELRKDAQASLSSISQNVHMPLSTIYDKINRFHREEVIKKYAVLVNFSKLDLHHQTQLAIRVAKPSKGSLLLYLQKNLAINSIHEINGGFDFLVETVHHDVKEYLAFVEELKERFEILELHSYQIVKEVEREKFI
ncbi:MAG: Lrp/AsnC family transcriptional regulator [Nanoarchaeota archaeon]